MEIQNLNLGQNEIIVARPHTLEGPTQAGRLVNEGCSPPETPTVTSIDLRRCGRPPQAPFYDRPIRAYGVVSQREAWKPGTDGLYPRPRGARPPTEHSRRVPVWNPRVEGVRRQQAMLDTADRLSPAGAFYIAADALTKKNGQDWGLAKVFGAFHSVYAITQHCATRSPGSVKFLAYNTMEQVVSKGLLTRQSILATGSSDCRCATSSQIDRGPSSACQVLHFFRRLAGHASPGSWLTRGRCLRNRCRRPFGLHTTQVEPLGT